MDKADVVAPFVGSFKPVAEGGCPDARPPPTPPAVLSESTHHGQRRPAPAAADYPPRGRCYPLPSCPVPNAKCQAEMDAYCNLGNNSVGGNGSCPIAGDHGAKGSTGVCTTPLYAVNSTGNGHGPGKAHDYRCFSGASLNANHTKYVSRFLLHNSQPVSQD